MITWDKFISVIRLKQPGFTHNTSAPFTKNKEKIQNFKESGDSQYIHQIEQDKASFQHNMVYGDFKDMPRRRASGKVLRDKVLKI